LISSKVDGDFKYYTTNKSQKQDRANRQSPESLCCKPLPKIANDMYNPCHEIKPQANRSRSSRRYMRVTGTCHGLRLKEDIQSPGPTGSGLFVLPLGIICQ